MATGRARQNFGGAVAPSGTPLAPTLLRGDKNEYRQQQLHDENCDLNDERAYIVMLTTTGTAATTKPTNKMMKKKGPDVEARYGRLAGRQLCNRVSFFK